MQKKDAGKSPEIKKQVIEQKPVLLESAIQIKREIIVKEKEEVNKKFIEKDNPKIETIENKKEHNNIEELPRENFFVRHKARIIKLSIVVLIIVAFTVGCFFLFKELGFLNKQELSEKMSGKGVFGVCAIFIGLFVLQAVCLCMIPGNTTLFISVAWLVFDNFWVVFAISVLGVWISGVVLFLLGRYGGRRVIYWLFPKEQVDKNLGWITGKGASALPAFFLIPFMPNDMVCMVCGMSKLRFWQFLMIIIPFRVIEVLMILSYPYLISFFVEGRPVQDVLITINVLIIDIVLIALYYRTIIRIFRKTFLGKKYVVVEKPYVVHEEVEVPRKPRATKSKIITKKS